MAQDLTRLAAQFRAARSALGWSQRNLADASGVSIVAIARFEAGATAPRLGTVETLRTTLADAGVAIVDGAPSGGFTLYVEGRVFSLKGGSANLPKGD